MKIYNQIKNIETPKFVLIKNLETPYKTFETIKDLISGKIICMTDTLTEAKSFIPKFKFPSDVDKQILYMDIFEEDGDLVAGDELESVGSNLPRAIIDPDGCPYDSGKDVFGVTYTIVWICPTNKAVVVKSLLKQIQDLSKINKSSVSTEIDYMLEEVLERMIFIDKPNSNNENSCIVVEIKHHFEEILNKFPNGPTQKDWNFLDEM